MRFQEFVYLFLCNFLDYRKAFLQKSIKLFASALDLVAVIIRESSPPLSDFASRLLPFACNLITVHDGPLASGCHRAAIWGLGPIKLFRSARPHYIGSNSVSILKQFSKSLKFQKLIQPLV